MTPHIGASSCSFSSSQIPSYTYEYDVFLSFRGVDTRYDFTGHLYNALDKKGITTFMDNQLETGEEISRQLLETIERSKIAIIVFSENFASSRWCLDELVKILECKKSRQQMVRPVFYKVKPKDVRPQGTYGEALARHEERFKKAHNEALAKHEERFQNSHKEEVDLTNHKRSYDEAFGDHESTFQQNMDKLANWRISLTEAAGLSGWEYSTGSEAVFIDMIVERISKRVSYSDFNVADHPVGIESRVQDMLRYLGDDKNDDIRMVGIWGIGGIGKTTIARAVHNSLARKFHGSCFLENVGEESEQPGGLVKLQSFLLSKILPGKEPKPLTDVREGMTEIKNRLRGKKVLLILDGVNKQKQLSKLAGSSEWFGLGSRIIITTRDQCLLIAHRVTLRSRYEPKELNRHQAKDLFCAHAFPGRCLPQEYEQLADEVVEYTQGLPLALEEIGKFLFDKTTEEWQEELNSNRKSPQASLYEPLKKSYSLLEGGLKEVFLDIACFFKGESKNHVIHILKCAGDSKPNISVRTLQEKALTYIVNDQISMHNLLEVMGKEITLEAPNEPEPRERTRLCFYDDVCDVLTEGNGTNKIKGIMVISPKSRCDLEQEPPVINLSATSFSGMKNLKFFKARDAYFSGDIKYLPNNLRFIDWPEFPFESLPLDFDPKKLVKLNMPCGRMLQLGGTFKSQSCRDLKFINLESCRLLQAIPSFSEFPNLKELNLNYCTSLVKVDDTSGYHENLVVLSLAGCDNLTLFPTTMALKSAREINLSGCSKIRTFPEIVEQMESLTCLNLSGTAITDMPSSITFLSRLEDLKLRDCKNLEYLPPSIYELHHLSQLDLHNCSELVTFPRWNAESHQTNLWHLNLRGCKKLREIPELPPTVEWINADGCESLERFALLSNILERRKSSKIMACISLYRCQRLCDNLSHDMAGSEGTLCSLIHSSKQSEFHLVFPGNEVPRWFGRRKDLMELVDKSEFSFDVPLNIRSGNKGLAISAAATAVENFGKCSFAANVYINEERMSTRSFCFEAKEMGRSGHVWMRYIPFVELGFHQPPFTCRVSLEHTSQNSVRCTSYGVHLVMRVQSAL